MAFRRRVSRAAELFDRASDAGDLTRGSGGIRKIRWAAKGKGKSGGVRVIYYWAKASEHNYLLALYGKSERSNIDAATLRRIAKQLESMK